MSDSVQPVTFYVPASASEPVEVKVAHSGLRMVLVNRDSVRQLGPDWRVHGVYFLLGPADGDADRFRAYVGEVGRRDFLTRLNEHVAQKPWWSRALLVASHSPDGFNSAEIGWVEGRLYDVLNNAVAADLMNKGRPGDDTIAPKDRGVLERYVEPVMAALRACGAPPDTADQRPAPQGKKRAYFRESVKDLIDAGLLKPDTLLIPLRKHLTTTATVLPDGSLEVAGTSYAAVSTAAVAVSGSRSEPGWEFWGAPSGKGSYVPLYVLRDRLRADQAKEQPVAPAPAEPARKRATPTLSAAASGPGHRHLTRFGVTVQDLIAAGELQVGEDLVTTRRGRGDTATITKQGELEVSGVAYRSLSAAAKAVSGNVAEPGWEFWARVREGVRTPLHVVRRAYLQAQLPTRPSDEPMGDRRT